MSDPRATTGPFASWGHRTVAQVDAERAALAEKVLRLRARRWPITDIALVLAVDKDTVTAIVTGAA